MRELIVVRHAQADSSAEGGLDFDRGLTPKGCSDALSQSDWLREHGLIPDRIVSSGAARAHQTAEIIAEHLGFDTRRIEGQRAIYEATAGELLRQIEAHPAERLVLVGHNPGVSDLVRVLTGQFLGMRPGSAARIGYDESIGHPEPGTGNLLQYHDVMA